MIVHVIAINGIKSVTFKKGFSVSRLLILHVKSQPNSPLDCSKHGFTCMDYGYSEVVIYGSAN